MTQTKQPSRASQIRGFTRSRIEYLQKQYLNGNPSARANLARYRRAVGKPLGSTPETWQVFADLPENLVGYGDTPSKAERAIFHAITLYSLHQQSKTDRSMHIVPEKNEDGYVVTLGLGTALRKIANPSDPDSAKPLMRRFTAVMTAQTFEAVVYHLRGIVQLLRSENIPLDYGQLASDLYRLQFPDSAQSVHLNWARQLYRTAKDS